MKRSKELRNKETTVRLSEDLYRQRKARKMLSLLTKGEEAG
jgi:hypothetical protein